MQSSSTRRPTRRRPSLSFHARSAETRRRATTTASLPARAARSVRHSLSFFLSLLIPQNGATRRLHVRDVTSPAVKTSLRYQEEAEVAIPRLRHCPLEIFTHAHTKESFITAPRKRPTLHEVPRRRPGIVLGEHHDAAAPAVVSLEKRTDSAEAPREAPKTRPRATARRSPKRDVTPVAWPVSSRRSMHAKEVAPRGGRKRNYAHVNDK